MATLKEFEDALREQGMHMALAILERLRERDRAARSASPARRVVGRKMTPELAKGILELHTSTDMTQQEIAFQLGINQGRVNEVIKRGKWLTDDPKAPEAVARDKALARLGRARNRPERRTLSKSPSRASAPTKQLVLEGVKSVLRNTASSALGAAGVSERAFYKERNVLQRVHSSP